MKSPNNTTDIPDVHFKFNIDNGIRFTEKERRKAFIWEKKLREKDINCEPYVRKSQKVTGNLIIVFINSILNKLHSLYLTFNI